MSGGGGGNGTIELLQKLKLFIARTLGVGIATRRNDSKHICVVRFFAPGSPRYLCYLRAGVGTTRLW